MPSALRPHVRMPSPACSQSSGASSRSAASVCSARWKRWASTSVRDGGCRSHHKEAPVKPATFYGRPIEPPAEMLALLQPYYEAADQVINNPLGILLAEPMKRSSGEVQLGPMVAEATRRYLSEERP